MHSHAPSSSSHSPSALDGTFDLKRGGVVRHGNEPDAKIGVADCLDLVASQGRGVRSDLRTGRHCACRWRGCPADWGDLSQEDFAQRFPDRRVPRRVPDRVDASTAVRDHTGPPSAGPTQSLRSGRAPRSADRRGVMAEDCRRAVASRRRLRRRCLRGGAAGAAPAAREQLARCSHSVSSCWSRRATVTSGHAPVGRSRQRNPAPKKTRCKPILRS